LPEFFQQKRGGDDGGARIEGEAILPVHIGTATGRIELFVDAHVIAFDAQSYGRSQPTKPTANDDGYRTFW